MMVRRASGAVSSLTEPEGWLASMSPTGLPDTLGFMSVFVKKRPYGLCGETPHPLSARLATAYEKKVAMEASIVAINHYLCIT